MHSPFCSLAVTFKPICTINTGLFSQATNGLLQGLNATQGTFQGIQERKCIQNNIHIRKNTHIYRIQ